MKDKESKKEDKMEKKGAEKKETGMGKFVPFKKKRGMMKSSDGMMKK